MKQGISIGLIAFCLILVTACSKPHPNANTNAQQEEEGIDNTTPTDLVELSWDTYTGVWTRNGAKEEEIYTKTGGGILEITIKGNHLEGTYSYIQSKTERIAMIEDIACEIIDATAKFQFHDDGWGNQGILQIHLDEQVTVEILELTLDSENTIGMCAVGDTLMRENSGTSEEEENVYGQEEQGEINQDKKEQGEMEKENIVPDQKDSNQAQPEQAQEESLPNDTQKQVEQDSIEDIEQWLIETEHYRKQNPYWEQVVAWDEANGRNGLDRPLEPILQSDQIVYTEDELRDLPEDILSLARNEIYARHGYIFQKEQLKNYFLGQIWYHPQVEASEFNEDVFNEFEKKNLDVISHIK